MGIIEQIKELRNVSSWYKDRNSYLLGILSQAADTIESLYAKPQKENTEKKPTDCETEDMISRKKLIKELFCEMPNQFGAQAMNWFRELIDSQPKASVADCCSGWIGFGDKLPKEGEKVLISRRKQTLEEIFEFNLPEKDCDDDELVGFLYGENIESITVLKNNEDLRWKPLPKS